MSPASPRPPAVAPPRAPLAAPAAAPAPAPSSAASAAKHPTALRTLCETAARALGAPVVIVPDVAHPGAWRAERDPDDGRWLVRACAATAAQTGTPTAAPTTAATAADATLAPGALRLRFDHADGGGELRVAPPPDAPSPGGGWSDGARALAEGFATLAAHAVAADEARALRARLAELEQHVDEIQAIAALGSFQWFIAEDRIEWSAEQLRIHGREPATQPRDVAGFLACIHPDDRAAVAVELEALLRDGYGESRYRVVRPDGTVRTVEARNSLERGTDGQPLRVYGTVLDVTHVATVEQELRAANEVLERRVAERTAALQRSEAHFRRLIENAQDVVVIVDPACTAIYGSPSVRRVLGYDPDLLEGQPMLAVVHPDDQPLVAAWLGRMAAEPGRVERAEYRFRHGAGHWMVLESVGSGVVDAERGTLLVVNIRDVTARRAAEERVRAAEARYRSLVEQLPAIIYTASLEPGNPTTFVSPQAERLLGVPEAAWYAEPRLWLERIHPDDRARVEREWTAAHAAGRRYTAEYRMLASDGRVLWFRDEAMLLREPGGGASCIQGVMLDITERKAAEEALRRSEEHFRALIERSHDLVQVLDTQGQITYTGPSMQHLLGYTPEEILGVPAPAFMHPDDVGRAATLIGELLAHPGTTGSLEYRVRHKDGTYRWFEAWGRTLSPTSAGQGLVANARDITARVQAEAALRQAKAEADGAREEAERANLAKSEFLSRMSHELRTPLNSILGFAQLLDGAELAPRLQKGVQHILTAGEHLLNLINEVLDIARIEAEQQPMSIEPVRVDLVVREAVAMVRPLAAARGVRVTPVPSAADARFVRADRQRLTQVLLNLLSNAVKYNRPGGAVRIGVEAVGGEVAAGAAAAGRLRIRVRDEGRGIAPERQGELFVPFARLGAEHSGVEGTGLGLALSQRLARAMGGELALERSGADGSTFVVELAGAADPLADAPAAAARALPPDGSGGLTAATLLYVEDNLANLSLVEAILESRPEWRLVPALQGRLGLELAAEHAPDVILLDLHLPDLAGREVLRELRAGARTASIPVVVISADATPRTVEALLAEGADAFLTKPLDVRAFLATVERLLARPAR